MGILGTYFVFRCRLYGSGSGTIHISRMPDPCSYMGFPLLNTPLHIVEVLVEYQQGYPQLFWHTPRKIVMQSRLGDAGTSKLGHQSHQLPLS